MDSIASVHEGPLVFLPCADEDPFELQLRIVDEPVADDEQKACDTNDGCKPTCASACAGSSS